ncbi:csp [Symbiodinium natans]|uniref:Csp protein n=1 Tax=Symbiodinium natans TaxID=878477 RepID=A0A812TUI8_9DINO|nr:csp [Symbiodinium natans]
MSYTGTVRSFNPHKGWGFIECAETHKQFGSDVFLLKNDLSGFGVQKGDQVTFNVTQSEKGARATDVQVKPGFQEEGEKGQLFFGEVRSFNQSKGFGFLSSPATESLFGKDCFFIRSEFGDAWPEPGLHVQFHAKEGERGPIASDVRVLDPPGRWSKGFGKGFFPGFFPMAFGYGGFGNFPRNDPKETDVFFGVVKAVHEKGFGHLSSEAMTRLYGKDLFAHRTSIEEAKVSAGQAVSFNVSPGPKGAHAVNIQAFDETRGSGSFSGTVKAFNDTKGWGFIESAEAKEVFLSEIFLHKNELGGKGVSVGDKVQFTVDVSSGRATAKNVFDASSAPQCLLRRQDPAKAEQEFFDAVDFFAEGAPYHAEKFDDFFHMVSAVHEDDDEFRLMTSSAFDVVE